MLNKQAMEIGFVKQAMAHGLTEMQGRALFKQANEFGDKARQFGQSISDGAGKAYQSAKDGVSHAWDSAKAGAGAAGDWTAQQAEMLKQLGLAHPEAAGAGLGAAGGAGLGALIGGKGNRGTGAAIGGLAGAGLGAGAGHIANDPELVAKLRSLLGMA
jgi:hypothetical protein